MTLLERERAEAFFRSWQGRQQRGPSDDATRWLHDQLLDAAYDMAPSQPARRRLAITTAGVPIVYSHKSSPDAAASPFRMLVEPGGAGVTVAEQVRLSRNLLHRVLDGLGWQDAGGQVDEVLDALLPVDQEAFDHWHGGLGFGMQADEHGPELRLYCNVRHGELVSRWQRLTDAVAAFADQRAEAPFRALLERAVPRTVPAGVGLAVAGGQVRAIRLYVGLLAATADSAVAAATESFGGSGGAIRLVVDSYRRWFGELGEQDITLAYDYAIRDGTLLPSVTRFKVDVWCEPANDSGRQRLLAWTQELAGSLGLAPSGLRAFFAELEGTFPGSTFQYVSLGCRSQAEELSVYLVPGRSTEADGGPRAAAADAATRPGGRGIASAVDRAVVYLLKRQGPNGWTDFDTLAGPSTDWVSAFVALALAGTDDPAAREAARRTWTRLRRRRWWSPGWGFNRKVPGDADTTIWVLHLAAALDARASRRTLRFLSAHITDPGGIATYARAGPIRAFTRLAGTSFSGWCGAQVCVTAAGAGLRQLPHRERVLDWLRAAQQPGGGWRSYWWSSPHYATALASEALANAAGPGDADRVARAVRWAAEDLERRGGALSPFEQAFALRTLLLGSTAGAAVTRLVERVTGGQRADGSWAPSARLRIPPPDVTDPDGYHAWVEGGRGGGSIQSDANACFTTAAVLQALTAVAHAGRPATPMAV
jgi:hypothetical protein